MKLSFSSFPPFLHLMRIFCTQKIQAGFLLNGGDQPMFESSLDKDLLPLGPGHIGPYHIRQRWAVVYWHGVAIHSISTKRLHTICNKPVKNLVCHTVKQSQKIYIKILYALPSTAMFVVDTKSAKYTHIYWIGVQLSHIVKHWIYEDMTGVRYAQSQ